MHSHPLLYILNPLFALVLGQKGCQGCSDAWFMASHEPEALFLRSSLRVLASYQHQLFYIYITNMPAPRDNG